MKALQHQQAHMSCSSERPPQSSEDLTIYQSNKRMTGELLMLRKLIRDEKGKTLQLLS